MKKEIVYRLYPTHPQTVRTVICHCRESCVSEIRDLTKKGSPFSLAQYSGKLYSILPDQERPFLILSNGTETHRRIAVGDLDAVFAAQYEICYQGRWYPCSMFGHTPEGRACVIAEDPQNTSGLATPHSYYMWSYGVEFQENQIEAFRLWTSDPIDPALFTGEVI